MLILNELEPIHWAWAGMGIAAITLLLQSLANTSLGISTSFENLCALISDSPYLNRGGLLAGAQWRFPFITGLLLAGVVSAVLGGGWQPTWDLGMFDTHIGGGPIVKVIWMFAGGILIGLGTRMAGGCTSGHGIFGMSNFEKSSLIATLSFMTAGLITTNVIYRVIAGGQP